MNTPTQIISNILSMILWPVFAGAVTIMFLYAGILFVTASGDPSKITKAKSAVMWAIIGTIVGIIAYSASSIIKRALGA